MIQFFILLDVICDKFVQQICTVMSIENIRLWLTKATAIEFNTHGDKPSPSLRIDPNISCNNWIWQLIRYNSVVIQISFEHL